MCCYSIFHILNSINYNFVYSQNVSNTVFRKAIKTLRKNYKISVGQKMALTKGILTNKQTSKNYYFNIYNIYL